MGQSSANKLTLSGRLCLALNRVFKKHERRGRSSPESYSLAEYENAGGQMKIFNGTVDLRGKRVLDAGCGLGGKTVYYAELGAAAAVGIDLDSNHTRYARQFACRRNHSEILFINGLLSKLPFQDDAFEVIALNDVLEHIARDELDEALSELKRVMKPAGRIFLEFPPWTSLDASHLYDYIYTPWCHLLFSDETLLSVVRAIGDRGRHGKLSEIEHYQALNRITIGEFKDMLRRFGFKTVLFKYMMFKNKDILRLIPLVNKYLVRRVIAVLSK